MSNRRIKLLNTSELADMIENTEISETADLGSVYVHNGLHPTLGNITIVATGGEAHVYIA